MTKFKAMSEHIQARRNAGAVIGPLQALWGYLNMLFVNQKSIEGATKNIRAGYIRFDKPANKTVDQ